MHNMCTVQLHSACQHATPAWVGTNSNGITNCEQELDTCLRMQCSAQLCVDTVGLKPGF